MILFFEWRNRDSSLRTGDHETDVTTKIGGGGDVDWRLRSATLANSAPGLLVVVVVLNVERSCDGYQ